MNPDFDFEFPFVLRVSAFAYALFLWMASWTFYILKLQGFILYNLSTLMWVTGLVVAAILVMLSFFVTKKPKRLLIRVLVSAALFYPWLFIFLGSLAFAYLFTISASTLFWLVLQIVFFTTIWCIYSIRIRSQLLVKTNYMTKYFKVRDDAIIYSTPKNRFILEPPDTSNNTMLGRLWNKHGSKLAIFMYCGYPLQRLFYDIGGDSAVFLLLFLPLTSYAIARTAAGAYLFIYKVRQLEKLHSKPVLMVDAK